MKLVEKLEESYNESPRKIKENEEKGPKRKLSGTASVSQEVRNETKNHEMTKKNAQENRNEANKEENKGSKEEIVLSSELFNEEDNLERLDWLMRQEKVSVLKLRSDRGVFIIHLLANKTIKELYEEVKKGLARSLVQAKFKKIEISSNFPRKVYKENETGTLLEEGLFPNSAMILRIIE